MLWRKTERRGNEVRKGGGNSTRVREGRIFKDPLLKLPKKKKNGFTKVDLRLESLGCGSGGGLSGELHVSFKKIGKKDDISNGAMGRIARQRGPREGGVKRVGG